MWCGAATRAAAEQGSPIATGRSHLRQAHPATTPLAAVEDPVSETIRVKRCDVLARRAVQDVFGHLSRDWTQSEADPSVASGYEETGIVANHAYGRQAVRQACRSPRHSQRMTAPSILLRQRRAAEVRFSSRGRLIWSFTPENSSVPAKRTNPFMGVQNTIRSPSMQADWSRGDLPMPGLQSR